jgi:hypothetical protein
VSESACLIVVPVSRAAVPGRDDGAAVLARNRERARAPDRSRNQLVTDRGRAQVTRRERVLRVEHAVDALAERAIEPRIGHHPVLRRIRAGDEHGVPRRSKGIAGAVVCIRVPGALLHQTLESACTETIAESRQHVAAQLIDSHLKYKPRRLSRVTWTGANHERQHQRQHPAARCAIARRHTSLPVFEFVF